MSIDSTPSHTYTLQRRSGPGILFDIPGPIGLSRIPGIPAILFHLKNTQIFFQTLAQ
ncbi:hypothetical protein ccbrp13_27080 [Ktedonobacteria bacterium brp13]|nr:hypothetical protein ccbrp13_27080 [Ktedonobacteria bacterium brp13]